MARPKQDITGLPGYLAPGDRPTCQRCGVELKPCVSTKCTTETVGEETRTRIIPEKIDYYGYDSRQYFCTVRCGYEYACMVLKHRSM